MHSIRRLVGNSADSSAWETCFMRYRRRSRSTDHWGLVRLACVLLLLSGLTVAQRVVTATANIPFDFWAEGQKFARIEFCDDEADDGHGDEGAESARSHGNTCAQGGITEQRLQDERDENGCAIEADAEHRH